MAKDKAEAKPATAIKSVDEPAAAVGGKTVLGRPELPSIVPYGVAPVDYATRLTNSLMVINGVKADWGDAPPVDLGVGRVIGNWVIDWKKRTIFPSETADEQYTFWLLGCNDPAFPAGDVQILQAQNYGNWNGRPGNVHSRSPGIPKNIGTPYEEYDNDSFPFTNYNDGICYRYIRLYFDFAGSAKPPQGTFGSWVTYQIM
jgi:hypothetical protein